MIVNTRCQNVLASVPTVHSHDSVTVTENCVMIIVDDAAMLVAVYVVEWGELRFRFGGILRVYHM